MICTYAQNFIHKTGNTQRLATLLSTVEEKAMSNMHKNFVKFEPVVFELCERKARQTDKQTECGNRPSYYDTSYYCACVGGSVDPWPSITVLDSVALCGGMTVLSAPM